MANFTAFGMLLAFPVMALLLTALVVGGCLVAAEIYPRGHASADRLREFAGRLPRLVARGIMRFPELALTAVLALLVVLTLVFS